MRIALLLFLAFSLEAKVVKLTVKAGGSGHPNYGPTQLTDAINYALANVDTKPILVEVDAGLVIHSGGPIVLDGDLDLTVTGAANNGSGLVRVTVASHTYRTGDTVVITRVGGVTGATGTFKVTRVSGTQFDLQGSTFGGAYTSGGVVYRLKRANCESAPVIVRSTGATRFRHGIRVGASDAANLFTLTSSVGSEPTIIMRRRLGCMVWQGLEVRPPTGAIRYRALVEFGHKDDINAYGPIDNEYTDLPHDLVFRHTYIHGEPGLEGPYFGVVLNANSTSFIDSNMTEFKGTDAVETKALYSINGKGPYYFRNMIFSSSWIQTLWGGSSPTIRDSMAEDIVCLGCYYYKPWSWRSRTLTANPTGACMSDANGGEWVRNTANGTFWECQSGSWVSITETAYKAGSFQNRDYNTGEAIAWPVMKNQYELKKGIRALLEGAVIENSWYATQGEQKGASILFNQVDGDNNFFNTTIRDVYVRNNRMKNTCYGISNGTSNQPYTRYPSRISITNNIWDRLGEAANCTVDFQTYPGKFFQGTHFSDYLVQHNTALHGTTAPQNSASVSVDNYNESYGGNHISANMLTYGLSGWAAGWSSAPVSGGGHGPNSLTGLGPARTIGLNWMIDDQSLGQTEVDNNFKTASHEGYAPCPSCKYVASIAAAAFTNAAAANYRLTSSSPAYRQGPYGRDGGADQNVVDWSTEGTVAGVHNPYLDFQVHSIRPAVTTASIRYTSYSSAACTVLVANNRSYSSPVHNSSDGGGDRDRTVNLTGLTGRSRYWYTITCDGGRYRDGVFHTDKR